MVATDPIHGSFFAVLARRKGGQDDYVMESFQNYIDRLGLVKEEMKCDQGPSTLDVANALIKRCRSTSLIVTATPNGSKGSVARGEQTNLTIQGQLQAFREDVSMRYKTEFGPNHVLMGWMVRHCAWVVNNFCESALSFHPGQGLHWRSCAIWRSVLGAKPVRGWSQIKHEVDARSFCRQA